MSFGSGPGGAVDRGRGDLATVQRGFEVAAQKQGRSGHFEIQASLNCGPAVRSTPVAYDQPIEAPLVAQQIGQQRMVLGTIVPSRRL